LKNNSNNSENSFQLLSKISPSTPNQLNMVSLLSKPSQKPQKLRMRLKKSSKSKLSSKKSHSLTSSNQKNKEANSYKCNGEPELSQCHQWWAVWEVCQEWEIQCNIKTKVFHQKWEEIWDQWEDSHLWCHNNNNNHSCSQINKWWWEVWDHNSNKETEIQISNNSKDQTKDQITSKTTWDKTEVNSKTIEEALEVSIIDNKVDHNKTEVNSKTNKTSTEEENLDKICHNKNKRLQQKKLLLKESQLLIWKRRWTNSHN